MKTVTFFDTVKDLAELTGLSMDNHAEALWNAGFDLDDMDFGFVSDTEWSDGWWSDQAHYYEHWLLHRMETHCVGYQHHEYGGKHYYLLYHS